MSSIKINHKILSIPPYISTSWKNVLSLKTQQINNSLSLDILLQDWSCVTIPEIEREIVNAVFTSHAKSLEEETNQSNLSPFPPMPPFLLNPVKDPSTFLLDIPIPLGGFKALTSILQHDPEKKEEPSFPADMIHKITTITKTMGVHDLDSLPKAEPHCNCPHCQIARSMRLAFEEPVQEIDEEISTKDLSFKSWIIHPPENNIYKVIHPDCPQEEYRVFLGSPISCTCGSNECEHIVAVLNS